MFALEIWRQMTAFKAIKTQKQKQLQEKRRKVANKTAKKLASSTLNTHNKLSALSDAIEQQKFNSLNSSASPYDVSKRATDFIEIEKARKAALYRMSQNHMADKNKMLNNFMEQARKNAKLNKV
ncbi:14456_t:CDS:2 [Funneliformis geosporum]|uniref:14456_t:CDS:1 n=1 Tax=Funneliformis geosporum TaxID=1117311 RepID=A0A9W4SCY3_9GLOM|nr:14456_t:CDS:2 [Funneliformis geosporum]